MMRLLPLAALFLIVLSQPAHADPVSAFLLTIGKAFAASITVKALAVAALRTLISTGVSLLLQQLNKSQSRDAGLVTTHTTKGGTDPQATIVGLYTTGGHAVYQNAHGANHVYNTHVVEFGDLPGATLRRIIIDGEYSEIGTEWDPNVGYQILTKVDEQWGYAWIRFYDGTQTVADPRLVELYGNDPERPWTDDHILTGVCYAILTFYRKDSMFPNGRPEYQLELDGPGFYDPRKDGSVGGTGAQRWETPTGWDQTANPMVIAYNILRGIRLPCGRIYGGDFDAEDLPLTEWFAAFDACDLGIGEDSRPQFQGGYEVKFEEVPADILKELFAACNAQIVEVGGYWYPLVGDSGAAVAEITLEEDLAVSKAWQQDPFPGVEGTFNAITTAYPSPETLWNATTLETITKEDWVAEDGGTKVFDLRLPMVSNAAQARQISNALLNENRRFRTHKWPMLPEFFYLRPLKTINATSAEYGYAAKSFRITEVAYNLLTLTSYVSVRETDPTDFDPDLAFELPQPVPPTSAIETPDAGVPGFAVVSALVQDNNGVNRVSALRALWDASLEDSARALTFQAKLAGGDGEAISASTSDVGAGAFVISPVAPNTNYLVRAKALARKRRTQWTDWLPVTSPTAVISPEDLGPAIWDELDSRAASQISDVYSAMDFALDVPAELDILNRVAAILETARLEGAVEEAKTELSAEVAAVSATLVQDYVTAASQTSALAQLNTSLSASISNVSSTLTQSLTTLADENGATSQALTSLASTYGDFAASADQRLVTAANERGTMSAALTNLTSSYNASTASVNQSLLTLANETSALATAATKVETDLNGLSTSVDVVQSSVDGVMGLWGVRVNNNGVISGMALTSDLVDGEPVTAIVFDVDEFTIARSNGNAAMAPFTVIGGVVYLNEAVIGSASIGSAHIKDAAIKSAHIKNLAVETLHIAGEAVETGKLGNQAATATHSAIGGGGNKQIAVQNTTGVPIDLVILAFVRAQDTSVQPTAGCHIFKTISSGGTDALLTTLSETGPETSPAENTVFLTGTAATITTIGAGLTRYIRAVGIGDNVSQLNLIIFQRQK